LPGFEAARDRRLARQGCTRTVFSVCLSMYAYTRRGKTMVGSATFDLSGRVAVVTGGNGGIGRGIALGLGRAGAAVAILARNEERNRAVCEELARLDAVAMALGLDVSNRAALRPAMEEVERRLGAVDILVNNAGIAVVGGALELEAETWDRVIETDLNSVFLLSQIAARSMARRHRGKIINLASEYSRFGSSRVPSYSAAKGAVVQLTKSMAIELAAHNIQVNAILPGWIWSDMTRKLKGTAFYDEVIERTPARRFGEPEDIAGAAVFLASPASDFVTGIVLNVDGGYAVR
jgi:2-dehydro-3-deoxy-D-gluconate 5-dehydrogenase